MPSKERRPIFWLSDKEPMFKGWWMRDVKAKPLVENVDWHCSETRHQLRSFVNHIYYKKTPWHDSSVLAAELVRRFLCDEMPTRKKGPKGDAYQRWEQQSRKDWQIYFYVRDFMEKNGLSKTLAVERTARKLKKSKSAVWKALRNDGPAPLFLI